MPQFATSPLTFAQLTEADLRHACGPAVFAEAERLEESGHVVDSGLEEEVLVGRVRGTWRRVEEVRVGAQGARLAPACTCGAGGFCRHVGALLLDWIRHRAEFAPPATSDSWSPAGVRTGMVAMQEIGGLVNTRARTLSEELALLLESNTAAQLRRIAQARGISYPKSRTKAEMVQLLATALASPTSIDAALAQLPDSALLALDAVQLCGAAASPDAEEDDDDFDEGDDFGMSEDLVGEVYLSLGGTEATPLAALTDRGLLFTHHIPRAVCARLRPLDYLLDDPTEALAPVDQATTQPAIDRLFLAVASALADGRISVSTSRRRQTTLPGWETVPMGEERQVSPQHPRLDPKGLALLAERSSLAPAVVEFVVEMMLAIGAVEAKDHLTARPDRLRQYFERSVAERWHLLGLAWLSLDEWSELLLICGAAGPFALTARGPFPHYTLPLIPEAFAFRGFLTRLLARLSPDRWHDADDLLELVQQLVEDVDTEPFRLSRPLLAFTLYGMDQSPEWWLVERAQPDARLDLDSPEVQDRYYQTLTRALLTGPLAWLGVVDVAERGPGDLAFRVQPGALALLIGDALAEEASPTAEASEILIDDDLAILVPSRTTDAEVYRLLGEIGEFTGITRDGLRYRLTAERAQQLFDAGMTGPRLVEHLTRHARQLPREARARIERWWSSYGAVQLYDDLTLIELGDDYLLPELLATTSLDQALIHTFSPRLIAVDSRAAEALRAELERLGHTPRLVEGG